MGLLIGLEDGDWNTKGEIVPDCQRGDKDGGTCPWRDISQVEDCEELFDYAQMSVSRAKHVGNHLPSIKSSRFR